MLRFLKKSYPFNEDLKHNAKVIFFISVGVLAFILVFQPIEIYSHPRKLVFLIAGFFLSTFVTLAINLLVLPSLFPRLFRSEKWNVGKEILWDIWLLLNVSFADFLIYTRLFEIMNLHFSDVGKILLIACLPVAVLIVINQERLLRTHLKSALQMNERLMKSRNLKETLIHLESEYKTDSISITADALVLIRSADNYIEVYYRSNGNVKKQMVRSSLKKAEETLRDFDFIFKCHRSYIININHIKEVRGDSQGYTLFFDQIDFPVPVSQNYIEEFKKLI
ncbi:MAG: LytTR family transcriptional regulator [Bacteroidales bacterium]|jgi:hypothetical protein|nr:LytTR family transcriptional regulator [Bacteroidales bacterium]